MATPMTGIRAQDEIVTAVKDSKSVFGFEQEVWVTFLDFEHATDFVKDGVTETEWEQDLPARTRDGVIGDITKYLPFAHEKASSHRGLSASRSVEKLAAWVWLLGEEEHAAIDWNNYRNYGAPIIKQVAERYGVELPKNTWFDRMAAGEKCHPGCEEGCDLA